MKNIFSNANWQRAVKSITELIWPFFPVAVVMFVLWLAGKDGTLSDRSDLMLMSSVLFAESWWRVRSHESEDADSLQIIGFLGAVIAVLIACLLLLREVGTLPNVVSSFSVRLKTVQVYVFIASVLYGLTIRWRLSA